MSDQHSPEEKTIYPDNVPGGWTVEEQEATWYAQSYAAEWYDDALRESKSEAETEEDERQSKRREVVFSVCFVESFLYEQVSHILHFDIVKLAKYFPRGVRIPIKERWKNIWNELHRDGLLLKKPNFETKVWQGFRQLVVFRDGYVHGGASLPEPSSGDSRLDKPKPGPWEVDELQRGFAVKRVWDLVQEAYTWIDPEYHNIPLSPPE